MLDILDLPEHLRERCIARSDSGVRPSFVVHWMRTAIRLDECPTFDTARHAANSLGVPLLVYHGIDERYRYASYRHHRFLLEGAADVADRADALNIDHLVHVSREGNRGPYLVDLAKESGLVITDMVDLQPWKKWAERVSEVCCLVEVDSHCVLPRPVFGKSMDRPFKFRKATDDEMRARVGRNWPVFRDEVRRMPEPWNPPFEPVDVRQELSKDGGAELLSKCDIDPTVVAVTGVTGGSSYAIEHWENWCDSGIRSYHMKRNNAALKDGVSRMSPWIHYGMISTTRMVRDASSIGGKGAEKFLDEMLVFREHAQHHVHDTNTPEDWANIPGWAISSWNDRDPEVSELSPIELERGRSGDRLWDSAQTGLVRQGTMHNNVRMTWGKAFAGWRRDAEEAMQLALEVNDRFALDGRDPSSIAGVQWCFGLFDRAFGPVDPVMGKVRKRPTHVHENRIDMAAYYKLTNEPTMGGSLDIGIVGGGLSGMFAARLLSDLGHNVTVWDKGSRLGGRLTGWQTNEGSKINLGARSLDSIPRWMGRFVDEWTRLGLVSRKGDSLVPSAPLPELLEHLSEGSVIRLASRVIRLEDTEGDILVTTESDGDREVSRYDRVIVAVPVEQASEIAKGLGIVIDGESVPSIVAWGFCDSAPEEVPEGFRILDLGNSTTMVELSSEASGQLIDQDKRSLSKIITDSIGIPSEGWKSHKWRYSRASTGPGSVVTKDGVSFIGDAFGHEVGSAGAALDSASRAVSNLHLSVLEPGFGRRPVQSSLSDW
tara:strand:+ start:9550 stop:11862 length:2313 start_codon:yes stop_codon:yes gene_type:complete